MTPKAQPAADISLDLNDLCVESDVTARTVRYYIQQGLLPSPGLGAGARYGPAHLARLRLIRRMQREHLPLAEIRRRLEELDEDAILRLAEAPSSDNSERTSSAVDYVRAVLGETAPPPPPAASSGRAV